MHSIASASECIPWLVVLIIECLAIVILNIITIVVLVKMKRQLQRRSTYLIIHQAIVDLLVGAVSGPLQIEHYITWFCPLWKYKRETIWSLYLSAAFQLLFPFTSFTNLMAISLERLHAIFCPFRHRFVRKWVYRAIIIVIWLIPIVRVAAIIFLWEIGHVESSEKMQPLGSASECIPWFVVLIIECLAIVILNIITIVVFVKKKRQLQRRRTYLIIHLAIVDLLAGAVSGPLMIEDVVTLFCPLWKYRRMTLWSYHLFTVFQLLFPFTSFTNLMAISLERLHATFCPFRHRFVSKWVYRAIIIVIWLIPIVRVAAIIFLSEIGYVEVINTYFYLPFYAVYLFVICVSYILVVIKVRCSRHLQFHSRSKRERKLTGTALIVSLVSLLCFLPAIIYIACCGLSLNYFQNARFHLASLVLFYANSLVNPIIYALRMPGFREGSQTFLVSPQQICHFVTLGERRLKSTMRKGK
ncbi:hypothetical protein pdam_00016460, partial [Pocillopora damicornis]